MFVAFYSVNVQTITKKTKGNRLKKIPGAAGLFQIAVRDPFWI